jgi:hypothetical protein
MARRSLPPRTKSGRFRKRKGARSRRRRRSKKFLGLF